MKFLDCASGTGYLDAETLYARLASLGALDNLRNLAASSLKV